MGTKWRPQSDPIDLRRVSHHPRPMESNRCECHDSLLRDDGVDCKMIHALPQIYDGPCCAGDVSQIIPVGRTSTNFRSLSPCRLQRSLFIFIAPSASRGWGECQPIPKAECCYRSAKIKRTSTIRAARNAWDVRAAVFRLLNGSSRSCTLATESLKLTDEG